MCSDAPSPDPLIGQAAQANADIAREALAYYKQKDQEAKPRQEKMDALATQLAEQQMDASKVNTDAAKTMLARYGTVGVAAEDAMYKDARDYDSAGRVAQATGQAATDVDVAMNQAIDTRRRNMARAGVNPADGRAMSMEADMATQGALAKASAINGERNRIKDMGVMLRKDAANFAKGMSSNAAQTFGTAAAAGGTASGAVGAAIGSANQTTAANGAGFGTAIQGNASAGSILNQEYSTNVQNKSDVLGSVASLAGGLGALGVKFGK